MKEAAKKPGEHRRGLTISAAVVIVAIGIYLVCPAAESPMSAENLPDSRKISADMCSGSAWDPLHQSLGQSQTAAQSTPPLTNLCLRHRSSLQNYVRDAKRSLQLPSMPIRTHQPDRQLHLRTMTNAQCGPCSNGMPSSIQWSPLSSPSWKACQASTSRSFRRGMALPCQTCSRGMRSLAPAYCSGSRATSPSIPSSSSQGLSPVGWSYGQAKNAHLAFSGAVLP